jgi:hypothetical protein
MAGKVAGIYSICLYLLLVVVHFHEFFLHRKHELMKMCEVIDGFLFSFSY